MFSNFVDLSERVWALSSFMEHDHELTDAIGVETEGDAKQGSESRHGPLQRGQKKRVMLLWNETTEDAGHDNVAFGEGWTLVRSHRYTGHLIARREKRVVAAEARRAWSQIMDR
jgi:hypothetical protein